MCQPPFTGRSDITTGMGGLELGEDVEEEASYHQTLV
jgi:hypothetical protein